MTEKIRKALDAVEDVLLEGGPEATRLSNLLSALRGPDSENSMDKDCNTIPIRRTLFPRLARLADQGFQYGAWDMRGQELPLPLDPIGCYGNPHFKFHIEMALNAIRYE